ncbi:MAG: nucleotidyltransferase domain-containing protein [Acidobacteriota bacterium]
MLKSIQKELKNLKIIAVYLFGSSTHGIKHRESDLDIGILFENNRLSENKLEIYNKLYSIFSDIFPAKEIDIVFLNDAPLSLQFDAIRNGKILYERDRNIRLNYEEKIILEYIDFEPIQREIDKIILERV